MASLDTVSLFNAVYASWRQVMLGRGRRQLAELVDDFGRLSTEDLAARCRAALRDGVGQRLDNLALGIAAFRRAPADLPPGSALYKEQELAALALTQSHIVQMEIGEGKTYALLPAAFALACEYPTVYIACANSYLAGRDLRRTDEFWRFVGAGTGRGRYRADRQGEEQWSRQIVYTTVSDMLFQQLSHEYAAEPPRHPLTFGALLLDDADVALVDVSSYHSQERTSNQRDDIDWDRWLAVADSMAEGESESAVDSSGARLFTVSDDGDTVSASLTPAGEKRLRELLGAEADKPGDYLRARLAVEQALIAVHAVREDEHYVRDGWSVFPIDRTTGRILRYWYPWWLPAVNHRAGLPPLERKVIAHRRSTSRFIRQFAVYAGLSGTVQTDALEYRVGYRRATVRVPRHHKRQKGRQPDESYVGRRGATNRVVALAVEAFEAGRPVLIGTDTLAAARDCHRELARLLPSSADLRLLSGQNEQAEARIFATAGEVGSVVVATQVASRGVDIRLSKQARANKGLVLIGLGHAAQRRYDEQFLGRAGRQGDPFEARFVCSLDDPLFRGMANVAFIRRELVGDLDEDDPIDIPTMPVAIRDAQGEHRWAQLRRHRDDRRLKSIEAYVADEMVEWFRWAQLPAPDGYLAPEFVEFLVSRVVATATRSMPRRSGGLTRSQTVAVADAVAPARGVSIEESRAELVPLLLGEPPAAVRLHVAKVVRDAVYAATAANRLVRTDSDPRTSRAAVNWALRTTWENVLLEAERLTEELDRTDLPVADRVRASESRIWELWRGTEEKLPATVIEALTAAKYPARGSFEPGLSALPQGEDEPDPGRPADETAVVIDRFLRHTDPAPSGRREARVAAGLKLFTAVAPISWLRTSAQVDRAVTVWRERQRTDAPRRHRVGLAWVRRFLVHLWHLGLAAPRVATPPRRRGRLRRLAAILTAGPTLVGLAAMVAVVAAFAGASRVRVGQPWHFGPLATLTDAIAMGGLFQVRAVTAPLIGGLVGAAAFFALADRRNSDHRNRDHGRSGPRTISSLVFTVLAIAILPWSGHDLTSVLLSVAGLACLTAAFVAVFVMEFDLRMWAGIPVVPIWLCYTGAFVVAPLLADWTGAPWRVAGLLGAFVLVLTVIPWLVRTRFTVVFAYLSHATALGQSRLNLADYRVPVGTGMTAHVVALLAASAAANVAGHIAVSATGHPTGTALSAGTATGAYVVLLVLSATATALARSSPGTWANKLNSSRQSLPDGTTELVPVLRPIRQRLLAVEPLTQVGLVVAGALLLPTPVPQTLVPTGLVIAFTAVLLARQGAILLESLYGLVTVPQSARAISVDVSHAADAQSGTRVERMMRAGVRIVVLIVAVISALAATTEVVKAATTVARWLGDLVPW